MKLLSFFVAMILFTGCRQSGFMKKYKNCDSLVVSFTAPGTDSIVSTASTTETAAIRKLLGFADGKEVPRASCGFDGNLAFYTQGRLVLPVIFKFRDADCRYFLLEDGNLLHSRAMSNEAVDFLKSLEGGKNYY